MIVELNAFGAGEGEGSSKLANAQALKPATNSRQQSSDEDLFALLASTPH